MKTLLTRRVLPVLAIICLMATMISGMVFSASAETQTIPFGADNWTVLAESAVTNGATGTNVNSWFNDNSIYGWYGSNVWNVKRSAQVLQCNTAVDLTQPFTTYVELMTHANASAPGIRGSVRLGDITVRVAADLASSGGKNNASLGWHVWYKIGDADEVDCEHVFGRTSLQLAHAAGNVGFWRIPISISYDGTDLTITAGKSYNNGDGVNGNKNADDNTDNVIEVGAYTPSITSDYFVAETNCKVYNGADSTFTDTYRGAAIGFGSVTYTVAGGSEPEVPDTDATVTAANVFDGVYEEQFDVSGAGAANVAWDAANKRVSINNNSKDTTATLTSKAKYSFGSKAVITLDTLYNQNSGYQRVDVGKFAFSIHTLRKDVAFSSGSAKGISNIIKVYYNGTAIFGFAPYATENYVRTSDGLTYYALNMFHGNTGYDPVGHQLYATDSNGDVYIKETTNTKNRCNLSNMNRDSSATAIYTPLTVTISADGTLRLQLDYNTVSPNSGAGFDVTVEDFKDYVATRNFSLNDVTVGARLYGCWGTFRIQNLQIGATYGASDIAWINSNYSTSLNAAKDIYRAIVASEDDEAKAELLAGLTEDALAAVDPAIIVPFKTTATTGGSIVSDPAGLTAVRLGDTVTLTATADEGYEFAGWATSSNKIIDTEAVIEVVATTYNEYKAIFTPVATEGTAVITLENKSGQTMTATLDYTDGDMMTVYDLVDAAFAGTSYSDFLKYTGYKLSGYRLNGGSTVYRETSTEMIEIAGNIALTAVYTTEDESLAKYTVTVGTGAAEEGVYEYAYNAQVTVTCSDANFSYWTANDVIVCYEPTYTFNVSGDVTVAPVTGVAATAQPVLYVFQAEQDTNYDSYVVAIGIERSVPENFEYEYVASGIVFYRGTTALDTLTLKTEGAVVAQAKNGEANGKYIAKIQLKDARPVLSYIAFVTYRDANGIEYTVYTNNSNDASATNVVGTITKA